jgi:hypothetical protein
MFWLLLLAIIAVAVIYLWRRHRSSTQTQIRTLNDRYTRLLSDNTIDRNRLISTGATVSRLLEHFDRDDSTLRMILRDWRIYLRSLPRIEDDEIRNEIENRLSTLHHRIEKA